MEELDLRMMKDKIGIRYGFIQKYVVLYISPHSCQGLLIFGLLCHTKSTNIPAQSKSVFACLQLASFFACLGEITFPDICRAHHYWTAAFVHPVFWI